MTEETTSEAPAEAQAETPDAPPADAAPKTQDSVIGQAETTADTPQTASEDAKGDEDPSEDETGAPETYEDFTLPEGMEVDAEQLEAFHADAKAMNLSQKQAQQLVDRYVHGMTKSYDDQVKAWDKQLDDWKADCKKDKEFGGKNFDKNVGIANSGLAHHDSSGELTKFLADRGLLNAPIVVKHFWKLGQSLSEDEVTRAGRPGSSETIADRWYGADGQSEKSGA